MPPTSGRRRRSSRDWRGFACLGKVCLVGCRALRIEEGRKLATINGRPLSQGDWIALDGATGEISLRAAPDRRGGGPRGLDHPEMAGRSGRRERIARGWPTKTSAHRALGHEAFASPRCSRTLQTISADGDEMRAGASPATPRPKFRSARPPPWAALVTLRLPALSVGEGGLPARAKGREAQPGEADAHHGPG